MTVEKYDLETRHHCFHHLHNLWRVKTSFSCPIHQLFQVPLEKEGQLGGPILAQEEIKTIFGSIPDILDVHTKIKVSCNFAPQGKL